MATETATETEKVVAGAEELPKAIVRRVVKDTLSRCSKDDADVKVHNDALIAFSESARIFIHYLSATSNDICKESKRQTINADDVLKAIEEIEFPEFVGPLKVSLICFGKRTPAEREEQQRTKNRKTRGKQKKSHLRKAKAKKTKSTKARSDDHYVKQERSAYILG